VSSERGEKWPLCAPPRSAQKCRPLPPTTKRSLHLHLGWLSCSISHISNPSKLNGFDGDSSSFTPTDASCGPRMDRGGYADYRSQSRQEGTQHPISRSQLKAPPVHFLNSRIYYQSQRFIQELAGPIFASFAVAFVTLLRGICLKPRPE